MTLLISMTLLLGFLKPIHNSFSVNDIFTLIDKSDLYFQSWYDNALYYPSINLSDSFCHHLERNYLKKYYFTMGKYFFN